MRKWLDWLTNAFPLWVLVGCGTALIVPWWFTWFSGPWIVWGLGIIMLGMGLTLTVGDFAAVTKMPKAVGLGFLAQFTIMPLLGWAIGKSFGLPVPFAVGLILVSCCPGGTASNVVAFLARANVCLSVVMTMCSTFGAVMLTPFLTKILAGTLVEVDAWGLFWSTLKVVVLPVLAGAALNRFVPKAVRVVQPVSPLVSVIVIALICASIIGANAASVKSAAAQLIGAVALLHACGFGLGYGLARATGWNATVSRTISIEVGMQNSGLGVFLARKHFPDPLTAVPCAISAVMHSVIGSVLAGYWRTHAARARGRDAMES